MQDLNPFSSATEIMGALKRRQISARELLEFHLDRIAKLDSALNSIVVKDFDRARRVAKIADERRAAGDDAPLLGLPVTIKESLNVQGLPSTAGVQARCGHVATADARTVVRLKSAGAVIFGKTNVCPWLADYIADNPIYGRTNNPWDLNRTCGGSSGGSAALAAGLSALDIGSDMGGSIRVPPAFCGLWGHRPSDTSVCNSGHFPGSEYPNSAAVLAIQGPQARSAADCELALDVMTGPDVGIERAWSISLPPARHQSFQRFRVAVLPPQHWLPVDSEIVQALNWTTDQVRKQGAIVAQLQPPQIGDLRPYYALFRTMLSSMVSIGWSSLQRERVRAEKLARAGEFSIADARGLAAGSSDLVFCHEQREIYRAGWREFFEEWDVLLTPITLMPAFEHPTTKIGDRSLRIGRNEVDFDCMSFYPSLATLAGQPATVFPAGLTRAGLPIGLQAIGPFLEDRTPLMFASLFEELSRGFQPPPCYSKNPATENAAP